VLFIFGKHILSSFHSYPFSTKLSLGCQHTGNQGSAHWRPRPSKLATKGQQTSSGGGKSNTLKIHYKKNIFNFTLSELNSNSHQQYPRYYTQKKEASQYPNASTSSTKTINLFT